VRKTVKIGVESLTLATRVLGALVGVLLVLMCASAFVSSAILRRRHRNLLDRNGIVIPGAIFSQPRRIEWADIADCERWVFGDIDQVRIRRHSQHKPLTIPGPFEISNDDIVRLIREWAGLTPNA
jgi:hypothetical protein